MKRFLLTSAIAAGMLGFTTPGMAQFVQGSGPGFQMSGFNSNAGMKGQRNGPKDGAGNQGQVPRDGTGYGAKSGKKGGGGICDGTGPRGSGQQGRGSTGGRGGRR